MADNKPYEEIKKEREAQKAAKERKQSQKQVKEKAKPWLLTIVVLIILIGGVWWFVQSQTPQGVDHSVAFESQGAAHIEVGAEHESYNSNPPTSGPHYNQPARPGFREGEDIADGHLIHSLEHGLIWISYQPDVSDTVKEQLKDLTGALVVTTARADNDSDIALAAWTRLDTFDVGEELTEEEVQRIRDFITRYANQGPERIPPGQHGGI